MKARTENGCFGFGYLIAVYYAMYSMHTAALQIMRTVLGSKGLMVYQPTSFAATECCQFLSVRLFHQNAGNSFAVNRAVAKLI